LTSVNLLTTFIEANISQSLFISRAAVTENGNYNKYSFIAIRTGDNYLLKCDYFLRTISLGTID